MPVRGCKWLLAVASEAACTAARPANLLGSNKWLQSCPNRDLQSTDSSFAARRRRLLPSANRRPNAAAWTPLPRARSGVIQRRCGSAGRPEDNVAMEAAERSRNVISFGPFSLIAGERLLARAGVPVELSARALDILIALTANPNEAISKRDLLAQVWPDAIVSEGSLRFHIASLRKALGDGEDGARYITTLAGRGYCFVAPVSRQTDQRKATAVSASYLRARMPHHLPRMVGRTDGVRMVCTQLVAWRFVTIVGAGGVGKTTVAVAVANYLIQAFAGVVLFVDLGALTDPNLVAASLAAMLGLSVQSNDPTPSLLAYLHDKRILLVFDNCEHIIDAAAPLAASIFAAGPQVHILATSREALRVEGEHVHRLAPLACPPDEPGLTATAALTFPAVQLFVERAAASGANLNLNDADAVLVASICRRLDGLALAIELAAARVETYGLQQTASLLDERLALLWQGQRTAPPRQQTLKAMLDWSYELLTDLERRVLRQLAVFVGDFHLGAALAVLTSATLDQIHVLGAIENLVAKSMISTNRDATTMRYRLLDTTRAYALAIRIDEAEFAELAARHATYYRQWLEQTAAERPNPAYAADRTPQLADLGNVRAALEWCFGAEGNVASGIALATAAMPLFLAMTLITECHHWSERALLALDDTALGGREEMQLQAALGMSSMFTLGHTEAVRLALNRSLAIAEDRGDTRTQLRLLSTLHMFHHRIGDVKSGLRYARRSAAVEPTADPATLSLAHRPLGFSLLLIGDLNGARMEIETALRHGLISRRTGTTDLGFDGDSMAGMTLARILWLQGHPVQAAQHTRQVIENAAVRGHPVTLSVVLIWAISVFLGTGDLQTAEEHINWFISRAESYSLGPYLSVGGCFKGQLAILRGAAELGVNRLQEGLKELRALRYELLTTAFNISLVQGLAAIGQHTESIALVDATIGLVESNGDLCYLPELLRMKGHVLLNTPQPAVDAAETCLTEALEWSRRQGARAWELRTAIDLAALRAGQGQREDARSLLQPVFDQFSEGFETADLRTAKSLLSALA
jgi:predicted ATPase/DNA-binding winged helix-turn-helix (wHTH) protein